MLPLVVLAVISSIQFEYVVDCSGWTGNGRAKVTYVYECRDGRTISNEITLSPRSDPSLVATALELSLERADWRYEMIGKPGDEEVLVIRGSKTSPIKSVTFKGDVWVPVVTCRVVMPLRAKAVAPPPREVKP